MRLSRILAVLFTFSLAGCNDAVAPEITLDSVVVTPTGRSLDAVGATLQFAARGEDEDGNPVTGKTTVWSTSDSDVATISATGLATAVAPGATTITATMDGVTGSAVLTVFGPSQPCPTPRTVELVVGEARTYDASECLLLPSGLSGDRYRVAVVRPASTGNDWDVLATRLSVQGVGVTATPEAEAAPSALLAPSATLGLSGTALRRALRVAEATQRFHLRLRAQDAGLAREAGYDLLPSRPRGSVPGPAAAASPPRMVFDISAGSTCEAVDDSKRTGILISENDDLAIYQDSTQKTTRPLSVAVAQKMATYFSSYVKDMISQYWGDLPDIDGNGKIIAFASPAVSGDVAAFVWSGDFFPRASCEASNEKELIYFSTDIILDMEGSNPTYQALETLGHEAKHVVSLYNRIAATRRAGSSQSQPDWIEEGTAEISGEISSRLAWAANGGPALNETVDGAAFKPGGTTKVTEDNYGVTLHLARTVWYLSGQPNGLVVAPQGAGSESNVYASGWTFFRWLGDAYGGAASAPMAEAPLFRALTDSLAPAGTAGLSAETGKSFAALYEEFVNAILLHRTTAPEPPRHFTTYDFLTATDIFRTPNPDGVFPWPVTNVGEVPTASFETASYSGPIGVTGMRIHDFLSNGTGTGAQITLDSGGRPAVLQVVRLR